MTPPPTLRPESPADAPAVEAVTIAAFLHAPHRDGTEQHIVAALRRAGALTVSLVAEAAGRVIGHVAASPVTISDGAARWFGIGPLSVAPNAQRQGVGSALMWAALAALEARGAAGCVLLGDPAYYARFGFAPDPALVLPGVPAPYFQAKLLGGPAARGVVTYHTAFSDPHAR